MKSTAGILKKPSGNSSKKGLRSITLWQDLKKAFGLDSEGLAGLKALYRKEMMDNIRSRRFLVILVLIVVTSYASLYGALTGLASSGETDYLFLALYTTSGSSIPSFMSFIALLGPFVGIILGFDGGLMALNDRLKLRSMVVGEKDDKVFIASEEAAIRVMEPDAENIYAPAGGEPVIVRVKEGKF